MSQDPRTKLSKSFVEKLNDDLVGLSRNCSCLIKDMASKRFAKDLKSDQSFVTEVDFAVEDLIREFVQKKYPDHGVKGEEREDMLPGSEFQWITDPVDGTQNLVHGIPTFGSVIGVHYCGYPLAGAIEHPLLDLSYSGAFGLGSFLNGKRLKIDDVGDCPINTLDRQEILAMSTRDCFKRCGEENLFDQLMRDHPSTRVYYDIFSTTRAVEGQIGAVVEFGMKIWDIAATEILVTEAGGDYKVLRRVCKGGTKKDLISIVAGKPKVVNFLYDYLGGYKESLNG
ncbi:MAG TPA: inositol monophosphatase [Oligoflexia bacterium]|nr:inositol monophosphatase [Oligoflexia bacterium]HMP48850.1 inositol monophosphatase [Oligoflexia bacterium]